MLLDKLRQSLAQPPRNRLFIAGTLFLLIAFALYHPSSSHQSLSFPKEEYTYPTAPHHAAIAQDRPKRVAIIGAGASGSAAAFFLRRAGRVVEKRIGVDEGTLLGDIVVFDREGYVGGRE